jgi:hypothetical protein
VSETAGEGHGKRARELEGEEEGEDAGADIFDAREGFPSMGKDKSKDDVELNMAVFVLDHFATR